MPHTTTNNIIDDIFAGSAPLKKQKKRKIIRSQKQPVESKLPLPEIVHDPSFQPPRSSTSRRDSSRTARKTAPVLCIYPRDTPVF